VPADTKFLIVEGWRFLPHSYAVVNQWQLLAFLRRSDIMLKVVDLPFHDQNWKTQNGLFAQDAERQLKSIDIVGPDERADLTFRLSFPYDFNPSGSKRTAVFGTCESQVIRGSQLARSSKRPQAISGISDVKIVTPSHWSAEGFYKAGFRNDQVIVVPHGVDADTFCPMHARRASIREKMGITPDAFVFLSVGAMSGNKGIDILLQAFAEVSRNFPHARLILKGMDSLYFSELYLQKSMNMLSPDDRQRVVDGLIYFGETFSFAKMASLYQAADVYVSPYRAEGFNIPVLEAAASGAPIICTGGGATDDFVTDEFAKKIESRKSSSYLNGLELVRLEPNRDHLIDLMTAAIEDRAWRNQAAQAGPSHVRAHYTWDSVADDLLERLFN
jgi:glycosyltransferase involved in cell wall biosynthesis